MSLLTFSELWDRLRTGDESVEIEAKRTEEIGNSIMETVAAFSNEPGRGGEYLMLGVGTNAETLVPDLDKTNLPDKSLSEKLNSPDKLLSTESSSVDKPLSTESRSLPTGFPALPDLLDFAVRSLGKRNSPEDVRVVIRSLCQWREIRLVEIAALLGRNPHYVLTNYLRPMLRDGEVEHKYPDDPNHPQQAYRFRTKEEKPNT